MVARRERDNLPWRLALVYRTARPRRKRKRRRTQWIRRR